MACSAAVRHDAVYILNRPCGVCFSQRLRLRLSFAWVLQIAILTNSASLRLLAVGGGGLAMGSFMVGELLDAYTSHCFGWPCVGWHGQSNPCLDIIRTSAQPAPASEWCADSIYTFADSFDQA